jgi:two-component system, cell cycle response regulator DivK
MTVSPAPVTATPPLLARKGNASPVGRAAERLEGPVARLANAMPVAADPSPVAKPLIEPALPADAAMSADILIVEDDRLNLKLYRDLLEARGHQIAQSRDVDRILSALRLSRPDLIILDICPPDRTALHAAREIRRDPALREIPLIGVAELNRVGAETEILEGGCDACIAKPISVPEFLRVVEHYLNP